MCRSVDRYLIQLSCVQIYNSVVEASIKVNWLVKQFFEMYYSLYYTVSQRKGNQIEK